MRPEERISYPELGHIYPGDYLESIPFHAYIDKEQPLPEGRQVFDIRDFGAAPDDKLNTEPIRLACEACRDAGGGVVLAAGGRYRTGTVRLYSHTTLFIAPDAELAASRCADDMVFRVPGTQDFGEESSGGAFIQAVDAEDVSITGGGRIHGNGEWFVHEPRKKPALTPFPITMLPTREQAKTPEINTVPGSVRTEYRERIRYAEDKYGEGKPVLRRPSAMVWLLRCRGVRVENIILRDSMCWTLHPEACDGVTVKNVVIDDNRHVANTDGVDISGCSRVTVDHCFISCADDGVCVKNPVYTNRVSEEIEIRNCTVCTVMNGFKIGTGTRHDIRGVLVENCDFIMPDIYPGSVSGISIESCDGSGVEDVTVKNIRMKNVLCPLYILLNRRNQAKEPYSEDPAALYWGGKIARVNILGISAENAELPAILTGYADKTKGGRPVRRAIRDIHIRDYAVTYRDNEEILHIPAGFEEFLTDYPESNAHGDVDACGIWVRHADRVKLENIRITPRTMNKRETVKLYDVNE
ncbi:MAG: hypothetical protein IJP78_04875 [Clostridia bacterium]|nr:hypothetical protein [Clostridia bacterium]